MALGRMRRGAALIGGVAAIAWAGGAQAALVDLGQYSAFVTGNFSAANGSADSGIAAGGAVSLNSYTVGAALGPSARGSDTLVVGGSLAATGGQLHSGNAVVGGGATLNRFNIVKGDIRQGSPIDFAAQGLLLNTLADSLGAMAANGTTAMQWGGLSLTGSQSGLNIFTVQAADLANANNFKIIAPRDSQVLVNIVGGSASLRNMGFALQGVAGGDVLFNFYEAGSIDMSGIGLAGSILAPGATVNFNNGQLNGLLVAANYAGSSTQLGGGYTGDLLKAPLNPVPEPGSWALMIAGFGLVGLMLRRTRAIRLTAIV